MPRDWPLFVGIALSLITIALGLYLGVRNVRVRVIPRPRAGPSVQLPQSPLQILDQRLASGEISDEQYQYERYLLQQPK